MNEVWKDINGYSGLYQVSNLGRVRRIKKKSNCISYRVLKPNKNNNSGYYRVRLSKNNVIKMFTVHRLVATAFVKNEFNKPNVNHIDGDKTNNKFNNLEWVTPKENTEHAIKTGLRRTDQESFIRFVESLKKQVEQYSLDGKLIAVYGSIKEAGKNLGDSSHICACAKGKQKTAFGYIWKYKTGGGK